MTTLRPIILGKHGKTPVTLDPAKLVDKRMLLCANSGGGKSHALRLIAEQCGNAIPTLIIDPEGEWSTIRTHVHAVLVGPGGDVQADVKFAYKLARRLAEVNCSAVLDISELKTQAKRTFVRLFIEGLLSLPQRLWGQRLVIVDEAHKFAPESGRDAESRQAIIDLMDSGRKRGLGGLLATQRLSKIAKDASAEANNMLVGRPGGDVDLRRASDLLGFSGKSHWAQMREFEDGEFHAYGPAFDHKGIVLFRTTKETLTEEPSPGKRHSAAPPKPSKKVKTLLGKLGDLPKEAQEERDELGALRENLRDKDRDIRELKTRLRTEVGDLVSQADVEVQIKAAVENAVENAVEKAVADVHAGYAVFYEGLRQELETLFGEVTSLAEKEAAPVDMARYLPTEAEMDERRRGRPPARPKGTTKAKAKPAAASRPTTPQGDAVPPGGNVVPSSGAPYRLVITLLQLGEPTTRARAAFLSKSTPKSSTFRNAMSDLRKADPPLLRDFGDGRIEATDAAWGAYSGTYDPLPSGEKLIAYWRNRFSGANQRLFDVLVARRGEAIGRTEAAELAGSASKSSSTFRNAMSKLRRAGVLRDEGNLHIMLAPELLQ